MHVGEAPVRQNDATPVDDAFAACYRHHALADILLELRPCVIAHLPTHLRPVITFAYVTGWRIPSEVLRLEWRQIDFAAGEVRLNPGQTKNREGRVFPFTPELRSLLAAGRPRPGPPPPDLAMPGPSTAVRRCRV
jgi:integrase